MSDLNFTLNKDRLTLFYKGQALVSDYQLAVSADFEDGTSISGPSNVSNPTPTSIRVQFNNFVVNVAFTLEGNNLRIKAQAMAGKNLLGWGIYPAFTIFPGPPTNAGNADPIFSYGTSGPNYVTYTWNGGVSTVVNEDQSKVICVGWDHAAESDTHGENRNLRLSTRNTDSNQGHPVFDRKISAQVLDTIEVTYRFGEAVPEDCIQAYAKTHPFTVVMPDRRPIYMVFIGVNEISTGLFLPDPNKVISDMKLGDYQGVLVWDLEGYPINGGAYVGDPRLVDTLDSGNPLVKTQVDNFFKVIKDAGLKIGGTLRWSIARLSSDGKSVDHLGGTVDQIAQEIIDKATYAYKRWGWTLFYVDSTIGYEGDVFRKITSACPFGFFFPENVSIGHFGSTVPYRESRGNGLESLLPTLAVAQHIWPQAFCLFKTDDETQERLALLRPQIVDLVKRGSILLSRDPYLMTSIYKEKTMTLSDIQTQVATLVNSAFALGQGSNTQAVTDAYNKGLADARAQAVLDIASAVKAEKQKIISIMAPLSAELNS